MTAVYWFLKNTAPHTGRVFFGEIKLENYEVVPVGEPIVFVANHPSSFLDPIVCGSYIDVPIHFLGRADIFKGKFVSGFLRQSHMWPIYRDRDGKEALAKNDAVFDECYESLKDGHPILLYGEGVTDEQFIRRVKQMKKGPARIALGAEEKYNFDLDLKIVPVGINYTNSEYFGCDLYLRFAEPIEVKKYEQDYKVNETRFRRQLTREIEDRLVEQVVHVNSADDAEEFEDLLRLYETSMHYRSNDSTPALEDRWLKSKQLANKINLCDPQQKENLFNDIEEFWKKLDADNSDLYIIRVLNGERVGTGGEILELVMGFPVFLIGGILNLPLFYVLKTLPPKLTKRKTFYSGMKVAFGTYLAPIFLSLIYLISLLFIYIPYLYPGLLIGGILTGIYALRYREVFKRFKRKLKAKKILNEFDTQSLRDNYESLISRIEEL